MKSYKRIKFWKKMISESAERQKSEERHYQHWGDSIKECQRNINRYRTLEKWCVSRLLLALETQQIQTTKEIMHWNSKSALSKAIELEPVLRPGVMDWNKELIN